MHNNSYAHVTYNDAGEGQSLFGHGGHEGLVLSPLLFIFDTNTLIENISKLHAGRSIWKMNFNTTRYSNHL